LFWAVTVLGSKYEAANFICVWYSPAFGSTLRNVPPEDTLSRIAALALRAHRCSGRNPAKAGVQRQ
jgi:hypothetical protein